MSKRQDNLVKIINTLFYSIAGGAKKHKKGITEKCTFCVDRVDEGGKPFCVKTCIADAIFFGDLDDPQSEAARLIASRGLSAPQRTRHNR
jgi:Fe-S-cluster-containing dehydrogenase component